MYLLPTTDLLVHICVCTLACTYMVNICHSILFVSLRAVSIHSAASKGHLNILQLLVDVYGVDPTATVKVLKYIVSYLSSKFVSVPANKVMKFS